MTFTISAKSEVLFGEGGSRQIGDRLAAMGCKRVICIYDKGVQKAGVVDDIASEITKKGIAVVHFNGVQADPPDTMINACGELARKENVDAVVGIGGGSSLDTAKAVNLLIANPGTIDQYYGPGTPHKPSKPLILVPTTSGTASEITYVSVITDTKRGVKTGVAGPATIAKLAVVDPVLTRGLPPSITAATGMDAFAHALEAYTSKAHNIMSDMLAEKALELIVTYLPKAVADGADMSARTQMSFACLLAGMSFNDAVPHLGHAFGHTLGSMFHVAHGIGCAIAQPAVVDLVADIMPEKIRKLGALMGLHLDTSLSPVELAKQVGGAITAFSKGIGIPTLKQLNIPEADLERLAKGMLTDVCFIFVPKPMEYPDVLAAVKKAYAS